MRSRTAETTAIASMLDDYQLLDFSVDFGGGGRKRERFGRYVVERPAVFLSSDFSAKFAKSGAPPHPSSTSLTAGRPLSREGTGEEFRVDFRYVRATGDTTGRWLRSDGTPLNEAVSWNVAAGKLSFELRLTDSGQVGLFPEQADNWRWIAAQVTRIVANAHEHELEPPRVLNLFAYTGASTLAAAAAGIEVVHVDAARPVVGWARRNAELSGLAAAPIRWLVDDAHAFVRRELRRGRRYAGIVLDPPSYGHGVKGRSIQGRDWRLERDLPELLADCRRLLADAAGFLLLTCHTTGMTAPRLGQWFAERTGLQPTDTSELALTSASGERLHSGVCVRWSGDLSTATHRAR